MHKYMQEIIDNPTNHDYLIVSYDKTEDIIRTKIIDNYYYIIIIKFDYISTYQCYEIPKDIEIYDSTTLIKRMKNSKIKKIIYNYIMLNYPEKYEEFKLLNN